MSRGRGGKTSSLTHEQLQRMGCIGKDMPQVMAAPPPSYPTLMNKPYPLKPGCDKYEKIWWAKFRRNMRASPCTIWPKNVQPPKFEEPELTERKKDILKLKLPTFYWDRMPNEVSPSAKKRTRPMPTKDDMKKAKTEDVNIRLKHLEEAERTENHNEVKTNPSSDTEPEEEADVEMDEEMDEENDYGNSYFDNGEAFNEEDDNLDDGPTY